MGLAPERWPALDDFSIVIITDSSFIIGIVVDTSRLA